MFEVDKGLYRGPRPTNFDDLKAKKISLTICLQSGIFEFFKNDEYEDDALRELYAIKRLNYKMSDFVGPTAKQLRGIVAVIEARLGYGSTILVHCAKGVDRTGLVCGAYRILVQGWTYDAAVYEMDRLGFHKIPYQLWKRALRELAEEKSK